MPPADGRPGTLLFYRDGALIAQPFDADTETLGGNPVPVIDDVAYNATGIGASFSVCRLTGVWQSSSQPARLTASSHGSIGMVRKQGPWGRPVTTNSQEFLRTGIASLTTRPDEETGKSRRLGDGDRARSRVTPDGSCRQRLVSSVGARWQADAVRIGSRRRHRVANLYQEIDGPRQRGRISPVPDGTDSPSAAVRLVSRRPLDFLRHRGHWSGVGVRRPQTLPLSRDPVSRKAMAAFPPDGKWMAYVSDETGRYEVYVRPFAGTPASAQGKIQVSDGTGAITRCGDRRVRSSSTCRATSTSTR